MARTSKSPFDINLGLGTREEFLITGSFAITMLQHLQERKPFGFGSRQNLLALGIKEFISRRCGRRLEIRKLAARFLLSLNHESDPSVRMRPFEWSGIGSMPSHIMAN